MEKARLDQVKMDTEQMKMALQQDAKERCERAWKKIEKACEEEQATLLHGITLWSDGRVVPQLVVIPRK